MIDKQDVVGFYKTELKTTLKVIKAIPEGHMDYKPHEKSNSLKDILKTLIVGNVLNEKFIIGEQPANSMEGVPEFDSIASAAEIFERMSGEFMTKLEAAPGDDLVKPFSMWGMDGTRATLMFGMMCDMIHHRGQLSVYIRLLDGKVPSIYGPTSDEPMNA